MKILARILGVGSLLASTSRQAIALVVSLAILSPSLWLPHAVRAAEAPQAAGAPVSALPPATPPVDLIVQSESVRSRLADKRWQMSARADDLAAGPDAAFTFVRDFVGLDAYPGVLRGARGAFLSRRANAWDRALLLQWLLKRKGITARLARGRLDGGVLDRAFGRMFDAVHPAPGDTTVSAAPGPSPLGARIRARAMRDNDALTRALGTTALADVQSRDRARADLADHVWVQAQINGAWTDLDPLQADSQPGHRSCEPTATFDTPPTSAYQRVGIRVVADELSSGVVTDHTLLQFYGNAADLLAQPLFLLHAPPQGANGALGRLTGSGWRPLLYVNGQFVRGESVPFTPANDAGAFFSGSDGTLVNESLEITITLPDGRKDVSTRRLVSRGGEDARRAGHLTTGDLAPLSSNDQGPLTAQTVHVIWLTAGMHNLAAYADALRELAGALTPDANGKMTPPPSPQDALWAMAVAMFPLVLWSEHMVLPAVDSDAAVRAYADSPRVIVMTKRVDSHDASRSVTDYDILRDHIRTVAREAGGARRAAERRLWFGALEGALEHELSAEIVANSGGHETDLLSTSGLLSDRGVVRMDAASADSARALAGSGDRAARMIAALGRSAALLVPKPADGQPARGWWEVSADGGTKAVIDGGLGGASYASAGGPVKPWLRPNVSARPGGPAWGADPATANGAGRQLPDGSWEKLKEPPAQQRSGGTEYTILLIVVSTVAIVAWSVVAVEMIYLGVMAINTLNGLTVAPANAFGM